MYVYVCVYVCVCLLCVGVRACVRARKCGERGGRRITATTETRDVARDRPSDHL